MKQHPLVTRVKQDGEIFWSYAGELYPDILTKRNAKANIEIKALEICTGEGLDIGAGRWPLGKARPIQNAPDENAYKLNVDDLSQDYVFSSHCLEHLDRPKEALALWVSKLKKNGKLFLYLPHQEMKLWHPGAPWVGNQHKWIPTFDWLETELRKLGMKIIDGNGKKDNLWSFHVVAKKISEYKDLVKVKERYMTNFFKNKTVMVLGSAPNVVNTPVELMNEYDIIVRVNNYQHFNECKRVDVYSSFFGKTIRKTVDQLRKDGVKLLLCKCPIGKITVENGDGSINGKLSGDYDWIYEHRLDFFAKLGLPYYVATEENFTKNNKLVGQVCTTGLATILDVLRWEPKKLYFSGFDFGMSALHNIYQEMIFKPEPNCHHFEEEFLLMKKLMESDDRLDCLPEMKEMFENPYERVDNG